MSGVGAPVHLEEEKGGGEESADDELHHRVLSEYHKPHEHEAAQHLDQLPPAVCGVAGGRRLSERGQRRAQGTAMWAMSGQ